MISQYSTPNGIFNVLRSDIAFYECLSTGSAWDADLIHTLCESVPNYGTILDIGGHIGTHSIPYSIKKPNADIYTFEPQKYIRSILESNKEVNHIKNMTIFPFGIGHIEKEVHLANDFTSDGYSSNQKVDYDSTQSSNFGGLGITNDIHGEKIQIKTIDSFHFKNVVYMKIDIEGAETLAVYGAKKTIETYKPILLIEQSDKNLTSIYTSDCSDLSTFNVTEYLLSLGYTRTDLGNANYLYKVEKIEVNLEDYERTIYSESGEDGILDILFILFNVTNKFYVEFGAEYGEQCNTRALHEFRHFSGVLFDMNYENKEIQLYKHMITESNVIDIFKQYHVPVNMDLLSVDIDSHDFYVLEEILKHYTPRIIVCEYNATHLPNEDKVVLKYATQFQGNYFGASILAFYKLGKKYNYSLVYANHKGVNLFFIHNTILQNSIYSIKYRNDVEKIYNTPKYGSGPNGGHPHILNTSYTNTDSIWN